MKSLSAKQDAVIGGALDIWSRFQDLFKSKKMQTEIMNELRKNNEKYDPAQTRELVEGELHVPLHNYTGPGTNLDAFTDNPVYGRIQNRYFPPFNNIDNCSRIHDLEYEQIKKLPQADRFKAIQESDKKAVDCYDNYQDEHGYTLARAGLSTKARMEGLLGDNLYGGCSSCCRAGWLSRIYTDRGPRRAGALGSDPVDKSKLKNKGVTGVALVTGDETQRARNLYQQQMEQLLPPGLNLMDPAYNQSPDRYIREAAKQRAEQERVNNIVKDRREQEAINSIREVIDYLKDPRLYEAKQATGEYETLNDEIKVPLLRTAEQALQADEERARARALAPAPAPELGGPDEEDGEAGDGEVEEKDGEAGHGEAVVENDLEEVANEFGSDMKKFLEHIFKKPATFIHDYRSRYLMKDVVERMGDYKAKPREKFENELFRRFLQEDLNTDSRPVYDRMYNIYSSINSRGRKKSKESFENDLWSYALAGGEHLSKRLSRDKTNSFGRKIKETLRRYYNEQLARGTGVKKKLTSPVKKDTNSKPVKKKRKLSAKQLEALARGRAIRAMNLAKKK